MNQPSPSTDHPTLLRGLVQAVLLTVIMVSSLTGYLLVLRWRGGEAVITTWTPVDEWLPFWPSWICIYVCPYLIGPFLAGFMSRSTFWWYVRCGLTIVAISFAIFIILPTKIDVRDRQANTGSGVTAAIFKEVVAIDDPPANAAPSLHVSLSCLLLWALLRDYPRWWPLWSSFIGLVWLSTMVTRQHHLIDVLTGILLASAVAVCPGFQLPAKHD